MIFLIIFFEISKKIQDTHVHRLSKRIGWVHEKASRELTYDIMNAKIPDEYKYSLHILLIRHGRAVCTSRKPKCAQCPLQSFCEYGKNELKNMDKKAILDSEEEEQEIEEEEDDEFEEVKKRKSIRSRRVTSNKVKKEEEIPDIEEIVSIKKEHNDSDVETMFVCGGTIKVPKTKKKTTSKRRKTSV